MIECVMVDTLPDTANQLLNILWDRNRPMTVEELMEAVKTEFSANWEKKDIQDFLKFLVTEDYVEKRHKGFKVYYEALGAEYVL